MLASIDKRDSLQGVEAKIAHFTTPLYLESGRILEPYDLAYETYGILNEEKSNVVLVCHALTGSHHAAGLYDGEKKPGWWDDIIGKNKAIDTEKFFIICINNLGSCFGSTSPMSDAYPSTDPYRLKFPVLTVKDMVKAQKQLLSMLGIHKLHAIVGGSLGGMQALQFAVDYPNFSDKVVAIATTYATRPWIISFYKVAIEAIRRDPRFMNGNYEKNAFASEGLDGLAVGRIAGHISYLSPESMDKKFGRNYVGTDGLFELFGRYEVERYMDYNTSNFSKNFDPLSFLYLVKALNIFNLARGYDSLKDALSRVQSKIYLFSLSNDFHFMPEEMKHIADILKSLNKEHIYREIDSDYGHDAFLVETEKFEDDLRSALEDN